MNRTIARVALASSALVLGGAVLAPPAMAAGAYPPATPPQTGVTVPPAEEAAVCEPVDGQDPNSTPPPGRATSPEVLGSDLPWYCTPISQSTSASRAPVATLAYTGAEIGTVGAAGLGLAVAGAVMVRASRRQGDTA